MSEVAKGLGVSERTIYEWIDQARAEAPFQALGQFTSAATDRDEMGKSLLRQGEQIWDDDTLSIRDRATATTKLLNAAHRHLTAKALIGLRQLGSTRPTANDDQAPREPIVVENGLIGHAPNVAQPLNGRTERPGARRDQKSFGSNDAIADRN